MMMETRRIASQTNRSVAIDTDLVQPEVLTSGSVTHRTEVTNIPNYATFEGMKWIPKVGAELKGKWSVSSETGTVPYQANVTVNKTEVQARTVKSIRDNIAFGDPAMQMYKLQKDTPYSGMSESAPMGKTSSQDVSKLTLVQGQQNLTASAIPSRVVYVIPQANSNTPGKASSVLPQTDVVKETVTYKSKLEKAVTKAGRKKQRKVSTHNSGVTELFGTSSASPFVVPELHQEIPVPEGASRLMGDTMQPNSGPLFIAVPLTNMGINVKNPENNSEEVSITPQQYQELLSAETPNDEMTFTEMQMPTRYETFLGEGNKNPNIQTPTVSVMDETINGRNMQIPTRFEPFTGETNKKEANVFNPRLSGIPKLDHENKMGEKEYEDCDLSRTILQAMWHMIEADLFWDAVLYIGKHHIKLHKLVMASISSVVHAKVLSSDESVLKLKLPADLDHAVVRAFVKYLYHGKINITTQNIKDLYRISTIFQMEQLKKHCYDFCKLTKMAHIIINSPQEDSMKAVQFGEVENKHEEPELSNIVDEITNETSDLIDNIDLDASEITLGLTKSQDKKQEIVFDWLGIDENQSNIPIRKRGRTRKGLLNSSTAAKTITSNDDHLTVDNIRVEKTLKDPDNSASEDISKESPEIKIASVRSLQANRKDDEMLEDKKGIILEEVANKHMETSTEPETDIVNAEIETCVLLPDPFDSGKFDESKLTQNSIQTRTMVTRFRGKNKNILEAATSKKARMDEGKMKKQDLKEQISASKEERTPTKRIRAHSKGKQHSSPVQTLEKENIIVTAEKQKSDVGSSPQPVVKKARSKRMAAEQEMPLKKETPMRPPPKKRTKEIREMMKNVDRDSQNTPLENLNGDLLAVNKPVKKKSKVKSDNLSLPKTQQLLDKIAEIDEKGRSIVGDRMFRCDFCGNEYICVKRILTHVVKTHDILLDRSVDHITVLKKNLSPKICDICGYKAKDANIYYIHFHKYFRHGVQLPQGWKPFTCDFCGKEFFTKFQLKEHKLAHFEETPFVCEHCGNGFKTRTCLNSHVFHKHSSVKRHKCPDCVKTFKTKTQMLVHTRTHSGEKPFSCPHCSYKSTTRGNMRLHLTNRHKFETDVITKIMQELKATETELPVDEDGNLIRMKESGFSIKLGQSDGQVLQIDPAGSAETRSMDTLADVASSKAKGVVGKDVKNAPGDEPQIQERPLMTDMDASKAFENQYSQMAGFDDVKANSAAAVHQELHVIQDGDFLDQDVSRPLELVITNEMDSVVEMQVVSSEYPAESYKPHGTDMSEQTDTTQLHDNRSVLNAELQAQESRMIVRDMLHQLDSRPPIDSRSLLKAALMQSHGQNIEDRDTADAQIIQVPESFFQEGNTLVAEQMNENLVPVPNQYTTNNRLQTYDTGRNVSVEPLQLVISSSNMQHKVERHPMQGYNNTPLSPQSYNGGPTVKVQQSEIPTIISEEMQQSEQIQGQIQAQALGTNQAYEVTSQASSVQHLSNDEHALMYQNYYQQNYHHGYQ